MYSLENPYLILSTHNTLALRKRPWVKREAAINDTASKHGLGISHESLKT